MALTEKLTAIADAIRGKTGSADKLTLDQMATAIGGIETGGGDGISEQEIIDSISANNFPAGNITLNCKVVQDKAFAYCEGITGVSSETVIGLRSGAFTNCKNMSSVDFPALEYGYGSAFSDCTALKKLSLPKFKTYYTGALASGCTSLEEVDLPVLNSTLMGQTFKNCTKLQRVNVPLVTELSTYVFQSCTSLSFLDFPSVNNIAANAFYGATNLNTIILRYGGVCVLKSTSAFTNTPFAAGKSGGTIYVPQALITEYQNATNWSTLYADGTCNFVAIEGSEYE